MRSLKMIAHDEQKRSVLIVLNDNDQDGRDVSWILGRAFWSADWSIDWMHCLFRYPCLWHGAAAEVMRAIMSAFRWRRKSVTGDWCFGMSGTHMVISTYTALQQCRSILRRKVSWSWKSAGCIMIWWICMAIKGISRCWKPAVKARHWMCCRHMYAGWRKETLADYDLLFIGGGADREQDFGKWSA